MNEANGNSRTWYSQSSSSSSSSLCSLHYYMLPAIFLFVESIKACNRHQQQRRRQHCTGRELSSVCESLLYDDGRNVRNKLNCKTATSSSHTTPLDVMWVGLLTGPRDRVHVTDVSSAKCSRFCLWQMSSHETLVIRSDTQIMMRRRVRLCVWERVCACVVERASFCGFGWLPSASPGGRCYNMTRNIR